MESFIIFVVGIIIGRFLLTKELGLRIKNKIKNKTIKKKMQKQEYGICPMCNGDGDFIDRKEERYVKCPQCNGTGKIK
jgi:DnaJ-class molecular chaperone